MKKALAKSLLIIVETGIEEIADRLKKRRKENERSDELAYVHGGSGAYDLRDRSADHSGVVGRRAVKSKRVRRRSKSKERQKT